MDESKTEKNGKLEAPWIPSIFNFIFGRVGVILFFAFMFFLMATVSHVAILPHSGTWRKVGPVLLSADEFNYILMVNSLLFDGDIDLLPDYQRVRQGGWDAGKMMRGRYLDHHSILVDPLSKEHAYFSSIFRDDRKLDCAGEECRKYLREWGIFSHPERIVEVPAHPIGFPLITAASLWPTFPSLQQTEGRMKWVILIVSWMTVLIVYGIVRAAGLGPGYAMSACALLGLASPWLAYSRSFFSEPLAGLALALGLYAMQKDRPAWAGAAAVLALLIKLPFVLAGVGWIIERAAAKQFRQAWVLALVVGAGALGFCVFNYHQSGIFLPGGQIDPKGLWGPFRPWRTLLDGRYGLIPFVPWALVSAGAFFSLFLGKSFGAERSLLLKMVYPLSFYFILLSIFQALGGNCYGCRYWVPFLPWLAVAAVLYISRARKFVQIFSLYLALFGMVVAVPGAFLYPSAWDRPPLYSLNKILEMVGY
jgi:hypothetical protein